MNSMPKGFHQIVSSSYSVIKHSSRERLHVITLEDINCGLWRGSRAQRRGTATIGRPPPPPPSPPLPCTPLIRGCAAANCELTSSSIVGFSEQWWGFLSREFEVKSLSERSKRRLEIGVRNGACRHNKKSAVKFIKFIKHLKCFQNGGSSCPWYLH